MTIVHIENVHTGLVVDIEGQSAEHGAKLVMKEKNESKSQQFKFEGWQIRCQLNRNLLDVEHPGHQGSRVISNYMHGGPNQRWLYHNEEVLMTSNGLTLTVEGDGKAGDYLIAHIKEDRLKPQQVFKLVPCSEES